MSFEASLDRAMLEEFAIRVAGTSTGSGTGTSTGSGTGTGTGTRQVIDAGCGTGRLAPLLVEHGLEYTGVDGSSGMLDVARALHPDLPFRVGDLAELPAEDASVDGVLAWYSIIHTASWDLRTVMLEFRRVLRTGGFLLLGFQSGEGERHISSAYGHDVALTAVLHDPGAVQQILVEAEFLVEASLVRAARPSERHPQTMILARLHESA